jgi:hypothetical protein
LLACDDIERHNNIRSEFATFPTTPGEVFTVTHCDHYQIIDGVLDDSAMIPPGCISVDRQVAEGDTYTTFCRELFFGDLVVQAGVGMYYQEFGFARVYLRRE